MMLITPFTALVPQIAAPGPRITSIRSISLGGIASVSQYTPEASSLYTLRPSTSTRSLLALSSLNPRMLMAQLPLLLRATCTPGASRSISGKLRPERRMSSAVITNADAAVLPRRCPLLDTEVTWMFISSSRDSSARLAGGSVWENAVGMKSKHANETGSRRRAAILLGLIGQNRFSENSKDQAWVAGGLLYVGTGRRGGAQVK